MIISLFVCIGSERPDCKSSEFKYFESPKTISSIKGSWNLFLITVLSLEQSLSTTIGHLFASFDLNSYSDVLHFQVYIKRVFHLRATLNSGFVSLIQGV